MSMVIVNFKSDKISEILTDYEKKYDGSPLYRRWRNHLDSLGIKYSGHNIKNIQIRLFNSKGPTMFGLIVLNKHKDSINPMEIISCKIGESPINFSSSSNYFYLCDESWIKTDGFDYLLVARKGIGEFGYITKFEDIITDLDHEVAKIYGDFKNALNRAKILFEEQEKNVTKNKSDFGKSVNDNFHKLGATEEEIKSYWDNIREKRHVTPFEFMGYMKYLDSQNVDNGMIPFKSVIEMAIESIDSDHLKAIEGFNFLPKDFETAIGVLKSYLETRFHKILEQV